MLGSSPVLMAVLLIQLFKPIHFEPMLVSKDGGTKGAAIALSEAREMLQRHARRR
jgi:hypothetical protein